MKRKLLRYIIVFSVLLGAFIGAYKYFSPEMADSVLVDARALETLTQLKTSPMLQRSELYESKTKEYSEAELRKQHIKDKELTIVVNDKLKAYELHEIPERKNPNFFLQKDEATLHGEYGTNETHLIGIYAEDEIDVKNIQEIIIKSEHFEHKYIVFDDLTLDELDYNEKFADGHSVNDVYYRGEDELLLQYGTQIIRAYKSVK